MPAKPRHPIIDGKKRCNRCERDLPVDAYYASRQFKSGVFGRCKRCHKEATNSETTKAATKAFRARAAQDPLAEQARVRRNKRAFHYGLSDEDYAFLMMRQGGVCAVAGCGAAVADHRGGPLAIDHCHTTGYVRGLLCNRHNWCLGHAKDSPDGLRALADYLDISRIREAASMKPRGDWPQAVHNATVAWTTSCWPSAEQQEDLDRGRAQECFEMEFAQ